MKIHKFKRSTIELEELIASEAIKFTALAMVSIFVPVYLYKLGFGLQQILLYFLVSQSVYFLLIRPVSKLSLYLHPKRTICLSYILTLISLLGLTFLPSHPELLLFAAALLGAAECIFWIPYHTNFSRIIQKQKSGKQVAIMDIAMKLASALGPVAGGLIATGFGAEKVFFLAALMMAIAALPLLMTSDTVRQKRIHLEKAHPAALMPDMISAGSRGIHYLVGGVAWPLFLALILVNYYKIGLLISGAMLVGLVVTMLVGYLTDKGWGSKLIYAGSILSSVVSLLRMIGSPLGALLATITDNIADSLVKTPYSALIYHNAGVVGRMEYIVRIEQGAFLGRITLLYILLASSFFFDLHGVLILSFALAGITAMGATLLKKRDGRPRIVRLFSRLLFGH